MLRPRLSRLWGDPRVAETCSRGLGLHDGAGARASPRRERRADRGSPLDPRDVAQASRYVVADIRVPHPVHNERGFVEALIEAGQRLDGTILMPASDERTVAVSRHKAPLGARHVVACPDWDITEQFIDKTKTNVVAERAGVAIPKTVIPRGRTSWSLALPRSASRCY